MSHEEYVIKIRSELVETASKMLDGELDLIEGCRRIVRLRFELDEPEDEIFLPLVGVESETDDLPIGNLRDELSSDALSSKDQEKANYLAKVKSNILDTCERIIAKFSNH